MSLLASRLILTNLIARIAHDLSNDVTKILAPYMLEKVRYYQFIVNEFNL